MTTSTHTLGVAEWRARNSDHLGLALGWLRLRLASAAGEDVGWVTDAGWAPEETPSPDAGWAPEGTPSPDTGWAPDGAPSPGAGSAPGAQPSTDAVADAFHLVREAERCTPPPALELLRQAFGLTGFERDVLLLCIGMELDTRVADLCARAHRDPRMPYPTFALAMSLFDDPEWSVAAPSGSLRAHRLVEVVGSGPSVPLTMRPLATDERIVHFLKGLNVLDERLARLVRPFSGTQLPLPASQRAAADELESNAALGSMALVQLVGGSRASRRTLVAEVAHRLQLLPHELEATSLPETTDQADELARLWRREARLLPMALLVTADDDPLTTARARTIRAIAEGSDVPVFLGTGEVCTDLADASSIHDVRTPTPAEQRSVWTALLGGGRLDVVGDGRLAIADRLATTLDLDVSEIERVTDRASWAGDEDVAGHAWRLATALHRPRLDALAQRIRPVATWADIVLPEEPTRLLHAIADQARHRLRVYDEWGWRERTSRGLGITALFSGESGTGKTMAAEVLAGDLGLDLYRIDLAGVVSKYIGETEKNLRRLFDAAESGGVLLFFDEADALFGKRSEVKDSHDRYANIEVDYLLQRMESYRGLAVLATNLRSALDPAFTRRLRFIVPFALPNRSEREQMWRRVFPARVPTAGLDEQRLARLSLSGALIHAIALNASFAAAATGGPVTMEHVLEAARTELRKADRSVGEVATV